MATQNPRVYTTFTKEQYQNLIILSKKRDIPISTLVKQLAIEALELQEDMYFSKLSKTRLKEKGKSISIDEWHV